MKRQITIALGILLMLSGCNVATANEESPSVFPSAGKEVIAVTKETAEKITDETAETASIVEKENSKDTGSEAREDRSESQQAGNQEGNTPQTTPQQTPAPKEDPVPQPQPTSAPAPDPEPEPQPTPQPQPDPTPTPPPAPPKACPGGKNPDLGCDVILDSNYYRETFSSYSEAMVKGQYYMDEVMYIGDIEITSYSVQEVYRNDHSIAYYGLNLWSNGSLIQ